MDIAVMEATAMGIVMERDTAGAIDVALMRILLLPMSTAIPLSTPLHTALSIPLSTPLHTALSIPLPTALSIPLSIPLPTAQSILQYTAKLPLSSLMPITH